MFVVTQSLHARVELNSMGELKNCELQKQIIKKRLASLDNFHNDETKIYLKGLVFLDCELVAFAAFA